MTNRVADIIQQKISTNITVIKLSVINDSARHAGHAGVAESSDDSKTSKVSKVFTGETHFIVTIISDDFVGLNRVDRQRKIYKLLSDYMPKPIHALNLQCLTQAEAAAQNIF